MYTTLAVLVSLGAVMGSPDRPVAEPDPVAQAIADFAAATDTAPADIDVLVDENVVWPDSSLGCPQPDQMYMPALADGYFIVLRADWEVAAYHGATGQTPFRCDDGTDVTEPPLSLPTVMSGRTPG